MAFKRQDVREHTRSGAESKKIRRKVKIVIFEKSRYQKEKKK